MTDDTPPVFDSPAARTLRRWAEEDRLRAADEAHLRLRATDAFGRVDERHGTPARAILGESLRHHFRGGAIRPNPHAYIERVHRPRGRAVRVERYVLRDDALYLSSDDLRRTLAAAADELARRLFADTPLALKTIVRTGIVPWDIEYQTTTDGATLERVTRLVEYERGARRG